jgi:hypothetical protein
MVDSVKGADGTVTTASFRLEPVDIDFVSDLSVRTLAADLLFRYPVWSTSNVALVSATNEPSCPSSLFVQYREVARQVLVEIMFFVMKNLAVFGQYKRIRSSNDLTLTPNFLFLFFERLAIDAEGGDWTSFEPWVGNLFFATFTDAIDILVHSGKRLIDLLDQPLLALTDTHQKILLGLRRRLIADVRERLLAVWIGEALDRLLQHRLALPLKITTNSRILFPLGRCLGFSLDRSRARRRWRRRNTFGRRACFHTATC